MLYLKNSVGSNSIYTKYEIFNKRLLVLDKFKLFITVFFNNYIKGYYNSGVQQDIPNKIFWFKKNWKKKNYFMLDPVRKIAENFSIQKIPNLNK